MFWKGGLGIGRLQLANGVAMKEEKLIGFAKIPTYYRFPSRRAGL